jgi:glycerophosphoryl diester phosphodiesterase
MSRLHPDFTRQPVAHRGLHDRAAGVIENSLPAVRAAAEAGYGIEIDVQLSADGAAMTFPDAALDRLTGARGAVRARQAADLARISLTGGRGDLIPALADTLATVRGRVPIFIEIKQQKDGPGPLEAATAAALAGYAGPAAIMSFDPRAVAWFRDNAPQIPRGLVSCAYDDPEDAAGLSDGERMALADLTHFDALAADFVSYGAADLPRPAVAALRARGVPTLCWTIRSEEAAQNALRHVDAITFEGFRPARA